MMKQKLLFFSTVVLLMLLVVPVMADAPTYNDDGSLATAPNPNPFLGPDGMGSLTTTYAAGNGQSGNMFDFTNIGAEPVTILSFDFHVDSTASQGVEVYYVTGGGSYMGNETNAGAWTLLGSDTVVGAGTNNPTPVAIGGLTVNPGETYGIYATMTTCTCIDYTNGTQPITTFSNANVQIDAGAGKAYPFGMTFSPRIWNGTVYYDIGAPTFVELDYFIATDQGNGDVLAEWETITEIDHAGFNLYRHETPSGNMTQINNQLIAAQGLNGGGAYYSFPDSPSYGTWYYTLEAVDIFGNSENFGPVEVIVAAPTDVALTDFGGNSNNPVVPLAVVALALVVVAGFVVNRRRFES